MLSVIDRLTLYRAVRISLMLSAAVTLWLVADIERGYWIAMTLMIIYMPFEPGLVNNRIKMRLLGTLAGLLFGFLLIELMRAHQLWLATIPLLILFALYFSIVHYMYATVFITIGVMVMFSMLDTGGMSPVTFMLARFIDTFIACVLCFIAEVFFRPKKMIAHAIIKDLEDILTAYAKHFDIMYNAFMNQKFYQISIEESTKFNNSLLSLKKSVELNKKKLSKAKQLLMEICLDLVFNMRMHLISVHYLAETYQETMQSFMQGKHEMVLFIVNDLKNIIARTPMQAVHAKEVGKEHAIADAVDAQIEQNLQQFHELAYQAQSALDTFKNSCQ